MDRARAPVFILLVLALSGCMGTPATVTEDDHPLRGELDVAPAFVVLNHTMSAVDCTLVTLQVMADGARIDAQLPPGFTALENDVVPGRGQFLVRAIWCGDDASQRGPFGIVELLVPIVPPNVPANVARHDNETRGERAGAEVGEDLYYVAAYTDSTFWMERYQQAGIEAVAAAMTRQLTSSGPLLVARGEARGGGATMFGFTAAAPDAADEVTVHRRTWHQSDHGLLLIDELLSQSGGDPGPRARGTGSCTMEQGTVFPRIIGAPTCGATPMDLMWNVERNGTAYWFHDTYVVV